MSSTAAAAATTASADALMQTYVSEAPAATVTKLDNGVTVASLFGAE